MRMKTTGAALAVLLACGGGAAAADVRQTDPSIYGGGQVFDVYRGKSHMGVHEISFETEGPDVLVTSEVELKVKLGPITAFYYRLDASERWRDGVLLGAAGVARKDGEDLEMTAVRGEGAVEIDGSDYEGPAPLDVVPSSHWNIAEMHQEEMMSLESGELVDVKITNLGVETIEAAGRMVEATRYRVVADLTADFWYDAEGRWVKCAFDARGQSIEYVLSDRAPGEV